MGNGASAESAQGHGKGKQASASARFRRFADKYHTLEEVSTALRLAGLESSNLILGIDMTKSNTWTGKHSFGGKNLHSISADVANPYEQCISIVSQTLAPFDEDNLIPVYGFGDVSTHDTDVFSFNPRDEPFHGFEPILDRYRNLISSVKLSGPTSFAPIVDRAASIAASTGQYHILVIIADGQVTRPSHTPDGQFSELEKQTMAAIARASYTPLSIVLVGVGDGPWDMMQYFDDHLPDRQFDNFQFVCATELLKPRAGDGVGDAAIRAREARFALAALMEVPEQYKAIQALGIGRSPFRYNKRPLEPPAVVRMAPQRSARHLLSLGTSQRGGFGTDGSGAGGAAGPGAGGGAATAGQPQGAKWVCGACTYVNVAGALQCQMCTGPPPARGGSGAVAVTPVPASAPAPSAPAAAAAPAPAADSHRLAAELDAMRDEVTCVVCMDRRKNVVFGCGHQVCDACSPTLEACPMCRTAITTRIKMF